MKNILRNPLYLEVASGLLFATGIGIMLFGGPSAPAGPRVLLQRPLKPSARMTASESREVVRVGQAQLQALGYRITSVDGISGPQTEAAVAQFIAQNQTAVNALAAQIGASNYDVAVSIAIDNAYRSRFGLPASSQMMA